MKKHCGGCAKGCGSCNKGSGNGTGNSIVFFGNIAFNTFAATEYLDPGYSANNPTALAPVQLPSPVSGHFLTLYVRQIPSSPPEAPVDITYRLRINENATALTLTMSTTDTQKNVSGSVAVNKGDRIDIEVVHEAFGQLTPQAIIATLGLRA